MTTTIITLTNPNEHVIIPTEGFPNSDVFMHDGQYIPKEYATYTIPRLYHTTFIQDGNDNTHSSIQEGKFSRDLEHVKSFNIHPYLTLGNEENEFVELLYRPIRRLKLLNFRSNEYISFTDEFIEYYRLEFDGCIHMDDTISITLFNPENCVSPNFEQQEFAYYDDSDIPLMNYLYTKRLEEEDLELEEPPTKPLVLNKRSIFRRTRVNRRLQYPID